MTNPRPNPYVGPRSFELNERLYGRDRELHRLLDQLISERVVLLHSPSGAGKTSLIRAGLIPLLREEKFNILPVARVNLEPGAGVTLTPMFNRYAFSVVASLEEDLPAEQRRPLSALANLTLDAYLAARPRRAGAPRSDMLLFDQFEEFLTIAPTDREGKQAFFAQLGVTLRPAADRWALFAIREDYLGALAPYVRPLPNRFEATFRLDLLGVEPALQAIQSPARDAGVDFKDEAARKLVDDLRRVQVQQPDGAMESTLGQSIEPVQLQVVCYRLWQELAEDASIIDLGDLARVVDVDQSLAEYYAVNVSSAAAQTGLSERSLREWFETKLITREGFREQVLMGRDASEGLDNRAVHLLENAHVIRGENRAGATWFELSHDRLIQPIRKNNAAWFEKNLSLFQRRAALWAQSGRNDAFLLRGTELEQADEETELLQLNADENAFMEQCHKLRDRERRDTRQRRIIAGALVVSVLLLALAVLLGIRAGEQAKIARAGELAGQSLETRDKYPILSYLLGVEAFRLDDNRLTQFVLVENLNARPQLEQYLTGHTDGVMAVAFSPDGKTLASGSWDGTVILWDVATRKPIGQPITTHGGPVLSVAFSPDGRTLASGLDRGDIVLWDVSGDQPHGQVLTGHTDGVTSVAFSPDGKTLASGGADKTIVLWDMARGQRLGRPLVGHSDLVASLAFSPDGKMLASGSWDGSIIVWDVPSQEPIGQPLRGHHGAVFSVVFSPDGKMLASGSADKSVILWDATTRQAIGRPLTGHKGSVFSVTFSPDGKTLASGSLDRTIIRWNVAAGQAIGQPLSGHVGGVTSVAFSPTDDSLLASASSDQTIALWDVAARQAIGQPLAAKIDKVMSVAFSPDGETLISGSADNTIMRWDVGTHRPIGQSLTGGTDRVHSEAFSPDGKILASAGAGGTITLWDAVTGQPIGQPLNGQAQGVLTMAFSPDSKTLASGGSDGTNILWDVSTALNTGVASREPIGRPLSGHPSAVSSVAFSPDGRTLASANADGTIILWSVSTHEPFGNPLTGRPNKGTFSMAFSPDGRTLASGNGDGTIILWDVGRYRLIGQPLSGHTDKVYSVAFSPDGKTLASGSADNSIILWNVATRQPIGRPLTGHTGQVDSVVFSPDGQTLASGSWDGTIIIWDVSPQSWVEETCKLVGRNLTLEEWGLYFQNERYHLTCPQLQPEP